MYLHFFNRYMRLGMKQSMYLRYLTSIKPQVSVIYGKAWLFICLKKLNNFSADIKGSSPDAISLDPMSNMIKSGL